MRNRHLSGGFVLAEFAIALPWLILLGVGLANVGAEIFKLGQIQLADYVLESEAQYVVERISHQARCAVEIGIEDSLPANHLKIVYHTSNDHPTYSLSVADVREKQFFMPNVSGSVVKNLNAKRQDYGALSHPITGNNFFGDTQISKLEYDVDKARKILHITLEMESLVSGHKIRLVTAVFMPDCTTFKINGASI